jgi:hypothetical protein
MWVARTQAGTEARTENHVQETVWLSAQGPTDGVRMPGRAIMIRGPDWTPGRTKELEMEKPCDQSEHQESYLHPAHTICVSGYG